LALGPGGTFVVCRYFPPGNVPGAVPFAADPTATAPAQPAPPEGRQTLEPHCLKIAAFL